MQMLKALFCPQLCHRLSNRWPHQAAAGEGGGGPDTGPGGSPVAGGGDRTLQEWEVVPPEPAAGSWMW